MASAIASLALTAVSAYVSYEGAQQQANAQKQQFEYQAQVAANNQKIANQMGDIATQTGEARVAQKRLQTAAIAGSLMAQGGGSGLDVTKGSKLDIQSSAAEMGELDALTIRNNAAREKYGYQVAGLNYGAQAQADELGAENATRAGNIAEFSSIVGGASSIADKYTRFQQAGLLR